MKVAIFAIVLVIAAFASASPVDEARGPIADKLAQLIGQLNAMLANSNANPALVAMLQAAITQLQQLIHQRGVLDNFTGMLGLTEVWGTITSLPATILAKLYPLLEQILFSSKDKWENAIKPILTKLVKDIKEHAANAGPLVQGAIAQLQSVLQSLGKREVMADFQRGFLDTIKYIFGLDKIWAVLQSVGGNIKDTFFDVLGKIVFAGTSVWNQAIPIVKDLIAQIQAHAENAVPLLTNAIAQLSGLLANSGRREIAAPRGVIDFIEKFLGLNSIATTIANVHNEIKDKFFAVIEKIFFMGSQAWAEAKPIFTNLVQQIQAHAENAIPLLTNAVAQLSAIVQQHVGKRELNRGLLDILGLNSLMATVQTAAGNMVDGFKAALAMVQAAGISAWAAAVPVLLDLIAQIKAHASNAGPLIQAAIEKLKEVALTHAGSLIGKRDLNRGIFDLFNISGVLSAVQAFGGDLYGKFQAALGLIQNAGISAWAAALPVLMNLLSELTNHASNGGPLVQAAIEKLKEIAFSHAINIIG